MIAAYESLLSVLPIFLLSDASDAETFSLFHDDISTNNILVDPDTIASQESWIGNAFPCNHSEELPGFRNSSEDPRSWNSMFTRRYPTSHRPLSQARTMCRRSNGRVWGTAAAVAVTGHGKVSPSCPTARLLSSLTLVGVVLVYKSAAEYAHICRFDRPRVDCRVIPET